MHTRFECLSIDQASLFKSSHGPLYIFFRMLKTRQEIAGKEDAPPDHLLQQQRAQRRRNITILILTDTYQPPPRRMYFETVSQAISLDRRAKPLGYGLNRLLLVTNHIVLLVLTQNSPACRKSMRFTPMCRRNEENAGRLFLYDPT